MITQQMFAHKFVDSNKAAQKYCLGLIRDSPWQVGCELRMAPEQEELEGNCLGLPGTFLKLKDAWDWRGGSAVMN